MQDDGGVQQSLSSAPRSAQWTQHVPASTTTPYRRPCGIPGQGQRWRRSTWPFGCTRPATAVGWRPTVSVSDASPRGIDPTPEEQEPGASAPRAHQDSTYPRPRKSHGGAPTVRWKRPRQEVARVASASPLKVRKRPPRWEAADDSSPLEPRPRRSVRGNDLVRPASLKTLPTTTPKDNPQSPETT